MSRSDVNKKTAAESYSACDIAQCGQMPEKLHILGNPEALGGSAHLPGKWTFADEDQARGHGTPKDRECLNRKLGGFVREESSYAEHRSARSVAGGPR